MRTTQNRLLAAVTLILFFVQPPEAMTRDYPIQPVPFTDVKVEDAFWSARMETNRVITVPYAFEKCEETGRINNFAVAGGLIEGKFEGIYFNDSDVFKVMEGAAYALSLHPDPELEKYVDGVIEKIAAAQEDDGYLYTARTAMRPDKMPPGGRERWSNMAHGHELYNAGHMYEAAVAHHMATGKRSFLDVAIRNADLVCSVFGPGKRCDPPGHQEIEIGLCKLYRATGREKYLNMARFFLDQRGVPEGHGLYGKYSQDHVPVIEQETAVGHSVRAAYLYCGMADVAALTGDQGYTSAISRIWEDVVYKKMYITGGIGAQGGNEGFGEGYGLPNLTAYSETCAAIANALWNHRMFMLSGDAKHMDVLERVIYNGFLSGISMEGDKFFYPNRLESHSGASRSPWFGCACCPSNIVRFVPSIPGYAYAHTNDELYINLFIGGSASIKMGGGAVLVGQETRYPWKGAVKIVVKPEGGPREFTLKIRIPGWARNRPVPGDLYRYVNQSEKQVTLKVNGDAVALGMEKGFGSIRRKWSPGDVVDLDLPMDVRRVAAHEKVLDDVGRVCLERGPIVYCAEGIDNHDRNVLNLLLPDDSPLTTEYREGMLNGVVTVHGKAHVIKRGMDGTPEMDENTVALTAIPYYAWCHRGPSQMAVWLAKEVAAAKPLPQ